MSSFLFAPELGPDVYESGLIGAYDNPADDNDLVEAIRQHDGAPNGSDVLFENSLYQTGSGKLSLAFSAPLAMYPDCLPGGAQERGDCVSWSTRYAVLTSYCNEVMHGKNLGKFDIPQVSDVARQNGVIATESWYWFRGHSGEGWTCSGAAKIALEKSGMWLRKPYEQFGFDLTKYDVTLAGRWGASKPPQDIVEQGQKTLIQTATFVRNYEELRDLIANGNGVSTCGGESWSGSRNEDGLCNRTAKGWAHAIAILGVDDRPETVSKYGCGLVLFQNSWGEGYLSGPRTVRGTPYQIPKGAFWSRWIDCQNRQMIALSAVQGWPARRLPNWGLEGILS